MVVGAALTLEGVLRVAGCGRVGNEIKRHPMIPCFLHVKSCYRVTLGHRPLSGGKVFPHWRRGGVSSPGGLVIGRLRSFAAGPLVILGEKLYQRAGRTRVGGA